MFFFLFQDGDIEYGRKGQIQYDSTTTTNGGKEKKRNKASSSSFSKASSTTSFLSTNLNVFLLTLSYLLINWARWRKTQGCHLALKKDWGFGLLRNCLLAFLIVLDLATLGKLACTWLFKFLTNPSKVLVLNVLRKDFHNFCTIMRHC